MKKIDSGFSTSEATRSRSTAAGVTDDVLRRFCRISVRAYGEAMRQKGEVRNDGRTGRMTARDVTLSQGVLEGICQAADCLNLARTATQWRIWLQEEFVKLGRGPWNNVENDAILDAMMVFLRKPEPLGHHACPDCHYCHDCIEVLANAVSNGHVPREVAVAAADEIVRVGQSCPVRVRKP